MPSDADRSYLDILRAVISRGREVTTRNSPVRRLFAVTAHFDRTPLVGARKTAWRTALREWEGFMAGAAHIGELHPSVRPWWEPFSYARGRLRHSYGQQFRRFNDGRPGSAGFDQIGYLIDGITRHPYSRRNVITTWHAAQMAECGDRGLLTTCHGTVIQAFVEPDDSLHLATYQRSADVVVGLPHNWVQYWAFLVWLAHRTGRGVGTLTWIGGDVHVYQAHYGLAEKVLAAADAPLPPTPELVYTPTGEAFLADDFALTGEYTPVVTDRAEMVV